MDREAQGSNEVEKSLSDEDIMSHDLEDILDIHGTELDSWRSIMENWQRQRNMCVVQLICYVVYTLHLLNNHMRVETTLSQPLVLREAKRKILMKDLRDHEATCRATLRMGIDAFDIFCQKLRLTGVLKDYNRATVEEQVARFLAILSQTGGKYRNLALYYHRSIGTISYHFHNVLRAVISLAPEFLSQPNAAPVPSKIKDNLRFFPYFKDCIGAVGGSHFRVKVHRDNQTRFRGCKEWPTQNVLATCNFDLQFTYVLAGWEGTASDSRIIKNAFARPHGLVIPEGKYYLGDGGLMLRGSLLTPYRHVRYHLKESSRDGPKNAKELFNHRHASLRNSIDRAFGVVTKRFPIIGKMIPKKGKEVADGPTRENVVWTEEMDNELLDCLLTEQRKGNRQEGQFTTHALTNVVYALRTKFPSIRLDKDKVKNRQRTLKKHFADVKDLFHNMSGFAWNPETKLFEAEREVWERLCEEKPNAKQWIRKPINNYDKLFELYGEHRAMGNGASSAFERLDTWNMQNPTSDINLVDLSENPEDADDEGANVFTPTSMDTFSSEGKTMPKKGKEVADGPTRENVHWTEEMDNELLDCLLTEQRKGNRQEGQLTAHALTNVVYALLTKFPSIRLDKDKVKNRQKTLKKHFADVKDLFHNMSGFAWNPETKLFEAEREVWERLCEEKPNAKQWIRKPINNYDKLFELYGEHRAMGNGAASAFEKLDRWNMRAPTSDINLADLPENLEDVDDEGATTFTPTGTHAFSPEGMPTISSERSPSINSQGTSSRGIKRKAPMGNLMLDKIDEMRSNIASMVQAIEQGNLIAERSARAMEKGNEIKEKSLMILEHQKAHVYKEAEIYAELIRLNVPQHKVMLAYRNFARSQENTRLLFGLPEDRRLQFVEMALLWSTNM
ncbi:unnamed protein product [Linum trigynum]|uniref:Myb/SANT-like domain-containing protein n=1 Tax=Linum trigynum TaxID=586398 RepID=A0AAV2EQP5_9ROSI